MAKNTKPAIRFKGFTDDWEQRKLGEVAENFEYGLNAAAKEFDGVNKYIRITDIDDESHQFNKEDLTSPDTNLEIAERYKLEKGDILFARTGASVGKSYIYRESDGLVYYAGFLIRGKIKEGFDTEFVFQNTLTEEYKNYIRITSQRSGQPGVNAQEYQEYSFKVPHYAEQKQIGMLFKNLDNLITLHQRKYDSLVNVKKAMLEKMFPKNGETVPEIRFKGFTDAWEQRKLLDCIEKITDFRGRTPKKLGMDWSEEGYLALSALNVKDGYIDFTQDVHYGDQELYDKWMTGNELHEGQVLFTTEAPMGNVAQIPDNRRYILSQRTIAFDVKEDIITENFLATVLRTPEMFAKLTSLSSGGTAKGVSQKTLSVIDVMIPRENKEQIRLASLFSSLDHLITLHQRKLEKLKNIKKSCLEKMFV